VRVAFQALASVLGGTQSLHTNSYDEALALPCEEAVRTALRTQQIIAYEIGVTDTIDPLAGSYAIESLTNSIERGAREYIERIDTMGGVIKAIEKGYIQNEIGNSAYQYQREVESKKRIVVGLNQFTIQEPPPSNLLKVNPEVEKIQKEKLTKVKKERDNDKIKDILKRLKKAAQGSENLMPITLEAVKCYTTEGEIADTLREVFGVYQEG
jgi:methylmalonyl-CoA mutase N-terminal domain/subunit